MLYFRFIMDIGMMAKECGEALGQAATVVFSNDDQLFENLRMAGVHTGDRVWRFPLWEYYSLEVSAERMNLEFQEWNLLVIC